jgi:hypothetical protein
MAVPSNLTRKRPPGNPAGADCALASSGPGVLEFAAIPDPSISVLDAICRLIIAHDDGDRRAVEHFREELSRDFGWVVRPPSLPPDWRGR